MKLDVVKRHRCKEHLVDICFEHGLAPSAVETMLNNAEKIKESAENVIPLGHTKIIGGRDYDGNYGETSVFG